MNLQAHPSPASPKGYDDDYLREKTGTGNYYARKHPVTGKPYHAAIDLPPSVRGRDGDPICAPWDGTIRLRSFGPAYGRQVTVVADDGYGAFMAHLSAIYVSEGQRVKAGQHIADMGNTGSQSVGTHGHFEKRRKWDDWNSVENPYQELRALEAGGPAGGDDVTLEQEGILRNAHAEAQSARSGVEKLGAEIVGLAGAVNNLGQKVDSLKTGGGQIDVNALAEAILDKQAERLKA